MSTTIPRRAIIDGPVFTHPDLRIQFRVPPGYLMSNGADAVTIAGSAGKAQFSGGRFNGSLDNYILRRVPTADPRAGADSRSRMPQHMTINGMPAAVDDRARQHATRALIDVSVVAYQWDRAAHLSFRHADPGRNRARAVRADGQSLRKITAQEAAAIRPRIIHVVTVAPGDTVQSLAEPDGLSRFQAGSVPGAERPAGQQRARRPARRSSWSCIGARRELTPPGQHDCSHVRLDLAPHAARRRRRAPEGRPSSQR